MFERGVRARSARIFYYFILSQLRQKNFTRTPTLKCYENSDTNARSQVPTGDILRVEIKEPNSQTPIGLPLSKYDDYYGSKKSILHFIKTDQGKLDPDQTTALIFWFESDKVAQLWKSKMDKIIEERGGGESESDEEEGDEMSQLEKK